MIVGRLPALGFFGLDIGSLRAQAGGGQKILLGLADLREVEADASVAVLVGVEHHMDATAGARVIEAGGIPGAVTVFIAGPLDSLHGSSLAANLGKLCGPFTTGTPATCVALALAPLAVAEKTLFRALAVALLLADTIALTVVDVRIAVAVFIHTLAVAELLARIDDTDTLWRPFSVHAALLAHLAGSNIIDSAFSDRTGGAFAAGVGNAVAVGVVAGNRAVVFGLGSNQAGAAPPLTGHTATGAWLAVADGKALGNRYRRAVGER